ncbi:MAG: resuscitation-promoting factor [Frankiales bacterium]|nr:resuscitation-promoting factor [Frankiales bacterium]
MNRLRLVATLLAFTSLGLWPLALTLGGGEPVPPRAAFTAAVTPPAVVAVETVLQRASRSVRVASPAPAPTGHTTTATALSTSARSADKGSASATPSVSGTATRTAPTSADPRPDRPSPTGGRSTARDAMWQRLVDCEAPGRGWRYGAVDVGIDPGYRYEGGPNFAPSTWRAYKPAGYPAHAYDATRDEQQLVAELVLDGQGVNAWPVCGPRVGLVRR